VLLLADEDIPRPSVALLRANGHDVEAIQEERRGDPDINVLALARERRRVLITRDSDFGELIFKDRLAPPPAVIFVRLHRGRPDSYGQLVAEFLGPPDAAVQGHFIVLEAGLKIRRRPFPAAGTMP
jgi:predicted nuclease of predicted toxin-antitoxin system